VVGAASTGEQAVQLAQQHMPDIILMDIMLKGEMNGIEAADTIRAETNIPVIFLTAYADESTLSKAKVTQPYGYIIKPFKEIDIHTSIEMALYKHKKEAEVLKERDMLFSLVENKDHRQGPSLREEQQPHGEAQDQRHLLRGSAEGLRGDQHAEHPLHHPQHHEGHRGEAAR
jgi:CheY-like chemotaxis protein